MLGVAILAIAAFGSSAYADTVTYSTTGVFSATGTNSATFGAGPGAVTLTYTPVGAGTSVTPFGPGIGGATFANFGQFTTSGGNGTVAAGGSFTLTVTQISPASGSPNGNLVGTFTGQINQNASSVVLSFSPGPVGTLSAGVPFGTHVFQLRNTQINPTTSNGGQTALNGAIYEGEPIPEPATMTLLGTGLAGIGAAIRRRRKAAKSE